MTTIPKYNKTWKTSKSSQYFSSLMNEARSVGVYKPRKEWRRQILALTQFSGEYKRIIHIWLHWFWCLALTVSPRNDLWHNKSNKLSVILKEHLIITVNHLFLASVTFFAQIGKWQMTQIQDILNSILYLEKGLCSSLRI